MAMAAAWEQVQEAAKKKMDPVDKSELKGTHADRKDKDIDNDGDVDNSDEYLHNRRKAVSKAMKKESNDLNKDNAEKAIRHDCATHVEHAEWGEGHPISGQHTIVETSEGEGYVTHYDVMFEHGIEKDVPVDDLNILAEMSHGHARKKKMEMTSKEKMKRGLYNGSKDEEEVVMNPKKENKKKEADTSTMESTDWPIYKKIVENRAAHYKGAAPADPKDIGQSPGGKKMKADLEAGSKVDDTEELGHEDARKAGVVTKTAPKRNGDRTEGDKKVINPPEDITKKGGMTA